MVRCWTIFKEWQVPGYVQFCHIETDHGWLERAGPVRASHPYFPSYLTALSLQEAASRVGWEVKNNNQSVSQPASLLYYILAICVTLCYSTAAKREVIYFYARNKWQFGRAGLVNGRAVSALLYTCECASASRNPICMYSNSYPLPEKWKAREMSHKMLQCIATWQLCNVSR